MFDNHRALGVSRAVAKSLFLAAPVTAHAVDGVGLFDFFPVIGWIFRLVLLVGALRILAGGFAKSRGENPGTVRRMVSVLFAVPLLYLAAEPAVSAVYVEALCKNEASLQTPISLEDWSPALPRRELDRPATLIQDGWRENVAPSLLEERTVGSRAFGVQSINYRLLDQHTGKALLVASYFGNSSRGPMACGTAISYWRLREQFTEKAWAQSKEADRI